ncbi:MAG TPA: hypothetical protein VKX49_12640 [Bryobacteraceae bacterium]|nr:hypothetical protein [Bryobacteraceae bacterium]
MGCAFFGPNVEISAQSGGCNAFAHADSGKYEIPWLGLFTKVQLGYAENKPGFSCKRCSHVDLAAEDCERVDKNSEGDTPGLIAANAYCNQWEPDKKRAPLSSEKLLNMISAVKKDAARMSPDEYRTMREAA